MTVSRKLVSLAAVCSFAFASIALAGPPHFTTIDHPDAVATYALGINPAGDIVGGYSTDGFDEHGFLLRNGTFSSYDYPGASWTEFEAITPQGVILGEYGLADNTTHGFVLRDGVATSVDLEQPSDQGLANTVPVHMSPEGTIVGCYHQSRADGSTIMPTMFGYEMKADGSVESFDLAASMHNGVNPDGDVVGIAYNSAGAVPQSYLIRDGVVSWFSFPGSIATQAWDISPTGAIVGFHRTTDRKFHGFVLTGGEWTSFDAPGASQTRAFGVNAGGDIVGYFVDATGYHGFLLSKRAK